MYIFLNLQVYHVSCLCEHPVDMLHVVQFGTVQSQLPLVDYEDDFYTEEDEGQSAGHQSAASQESKPVSKLSAMTPARKQACTVVETQVCESRDQVCEFFHGRVS